MWIKITGIAMFIALSLFVLLRFVPIGTRSSQNDASGGDTRVIDIHRPHYVVPREFVGQGGMNLIDFWSHAPDPNYDATRIYSHEYFSKNGSIQKADVQGFHINRMFANPTLREEIMAIRKDGEVYEYSVPGFLFIYFANSVGFRFLGQRGAALYYFYPFATSISGQNASAVIEIPLPLVSDTHTIMRSYEPGLWEDMLQHLKTLPPRADAFHELCADRFVESVAFAEAVFGKDCP